MRFPLLLSLGLVLAQVAGASLAEDQPVSATWQKHEMDFVYMGFTTRYSCEGLRDKVRVLLKAAGARPDFTVGMQGCAGEPGKVTEFPRVHLVFYTAALPAAGQPDAGEKTLASWKPVSITSRHPRELEIGDCELVEQFRDRLLPAFTIRHFADATNCIPHQLSGSTFSLRYDVLAGKPPPPAKR